MTKQEFLEKWSHDILIKHHIEVGKGTNEPYYKAIYEEDNIWKIITVDEFSRKSLLHQGTEEEMFEIMDRSVCASIECEENSNELREEARRLREENQEDEDEDEIIRW